MHTVKAIPTENIYLIISALNLYLEALSHISVESELPSSKRIALTNRIMETRNLFKDHWYGSPPPGCKDD